MLDRLSCFADHLEADLLQEQSWHMNIHIPVPKQAHVVHVIDGLDLGHQSWKHVSLGLDINIVLIVVTSNNHFVTCVCVRWNTIVLTATMVKVGSMSLAGIVMEVALTDGHLGLKTEVTCDQRVTNSVFMMK